MRPSDDLNGSPLSLYFMAAFGLLMVGLGGVCLLVPSASSLMFGAATRRRADEGGFTSLTGVRDVFLGGTFVILAWLGHTRALGWVTLLGALVALVDAHVTTVQNRGVKQAMQHWLAVPVGVALSYSLITS